GPICFIGLVGFTGDPGLVRDGALLIVEPVAADVPVRVFGETGLVAAVLVEACTGEARERGAASLTVIGDRLIDAAAAHAAHTAHVAAHTAGALTCGTTGLSAAGVVCPAGVVATAAAFASGAFSAAPIGASPGSATAIRFRVSAARDGQSKRQHGQSN